MFYNKVPNGMSPEEARGAYASFLSDIDRFRNSMQRVVCEWPISCEQFLSNPYINRIAWLGQVSAYYELRLPAMFRGGFKLLAGEQQAMANAAARNYLDKWLHAPREKAPIQPSIGQPPSSTMGRLAWWLKSWKTRGYPNGIPDEVPDGLMQMRLAPSWKAVALALLKNDLHLTSLGFSVPTSKWYNAIKRVELACRDAKHVTFNQTSFGIDQLELFQ